MTNEHTTRRSTLAAPSGRWLGSLLLVGAALAVAAPASAQDANKQPAADKQPAAGDKEELGKVELPTPDANDRAKASAEVMQAPAGKIGPVMVNAKIGPQFNFDGGDPLFAVTLDIGYALVKGNGDGITDGDLYVVAAPQLWIGSNLAIILAGGFQYDIPTPVKGLYVYPRATLGAFILADPGDGDSGAGFILYPAVGVKYVVDERINLGMEPFGMPLLFDPTTANYQFNAYAGVNF